MTTLCLVECSAAGLTDAGRSVLGGAAALAPLTVLLVGEGLEAAAEQSARLEGVARVLLPPAAPAGGWSAETLAALLVHGLHELQATHLVAASTLLGRSVLPRVAALLDVMPLSEIVAIVDSHTFERPVHAGAAIARLRSEDRVHVLGLRGSAFAPPATRADAPAPIERVGWPASATSSATVLERRVQADDGLPSLSGARIVVSGGRGVGSAEGYARLQPLARSLGAALGASRAAVDSGFAEASQQVGQTGQSVAPDLYLAMGISGAVQHWAGMKDSKLIVAVNKDHEAPIFQFADLGLVADLFEVLPVLESGLPARMPAAPTGQA